MENSEAKHCAAEACGTNSAEYPYLFFLKVPVTIERRILWCDSMGIPTRKGRMYCCTRHFDIPEDFDSAFEDPASSGMRLKLKSYVLPHKAIPFVHKFTNIYSIFNEQYRTGKVDLNFKSLLPAIERDLNVKVPINIKPEALNDTYQFLIDEVARYFSTEEVKSRYQLVQTLMSQRNAIFDMINQTIPNGSLQGSLPYRKIQPFLTSNSEGSLQLPVDPKQLELLYFECESKELRAFCRPSKHEKLSDRSDNNNFYPDLFFTPGVRINLSLPFLKVMREVHANSEKYLVDSNHGVTKPEATQNILDPFQKFDTTSSKANQLNQSLTLEYLDILLNLLEKYDLLLSQRQRMTLMFLLQQIKLEFGEYEMAELHVTYGYLLSAFKFFRVINGDVRPNNPDEDNYLYVKEVISPEVNFTIGDAIDDLEQVEGYFGPIIAYLTDGGESVDGKQYLTFAESLKNAITYTCMDCNTAFDSELSHVAIQEHRFCGKKTWNCASCKMSFDENDIACSGWRHDCIGSSY